MPGLPDILAIAAAGGKVICERCGTVFCWDEADTVLLGSGPKRFCSKECKKKDRKGIGSRRVHAQRSWRKYRQKQACSERPKAVYATEEDALCFAAGCVPPLYPYECPCGYWHLTTKQANAPSGTLPR